MNFKDTKRDETLGHTSKMSAMTTSAIIINRELPSSGLTQSMHDPTIPLELTDLFRSPGISGNNQDTNQKISKAVIARAIKGLHSTAVQHVFSKTSTFPAMPVMERLKPQRTVFHQLGAIFEDEGTIQGTYRVHDDIFLRQLKMSSWSTTSSSPPEDFNDRLILVHGDQLTAHHIRSVKEEQQEAIHPYDRKDWMLGIPAWFHVQMNLLNTIIRTYWAPSDITHQTHHCLQSDLTAWGRSSYTRENAKYHQMEPAVTQSFIARVTAIFYSAMRQKNLLPLETSQSPQDFHQFDTAIHALSADQFLALIDDVYHAAFTIDAWDGKVEDRVEVDIEFRTMCRMLQEIELFLTVRYAVKNADIGLLRYVVDPLAILFFGAGQNKYGHEMLFYRWNLSPVNSPELQRAILSSGLVNWHGRSSTWKAIDLCLEHLNCNTKIEMQCYKNSTHDTYISFNRVCLTNTWARQLRSKMEAAFGEPISGSHTAADATLDVFLIARNLLAADLVSARATLPCSTKYFDSFDIRKAGMNVLAIKVQQFNQSHVRSDYMLPLVVDDDIFDNEFLDIDNYMEAGGGDDTDKIFHPVLQPADEAILK